VNAQLKTGVAFHVERVSAVIEDIKPLMELHWEEVAFYRDMPLKPDFGRFYAWEQQGMLRIYTARVETMLVGYAIYVLMYPAHYADCLEAHQDTMFLHPDYRRGTTAMRLMSHAEDDLALEGVKTIRLHVKAAHDHRAFFERLGFSLEDHLYSKRLDL
jgi:GNAT superfamily N-acetyltransferase